MAAVLELAAGVLSSRRLRRRFLTAIGPTDKGIGKRGPGEEDEAANYYGCTAPDIHTPCEHGKAHSRNRDGRSPVAIEPVATSATH